jgi:hypothetical protein
MTFPVPASVSAGAVAHCDAVHIETSRPVVRVRFSARIQPRLRICECHHAALAPVLVASGSSFDPGVRIQANRR